MKHPVIHLYGVTTIISVLFFETESEALITEFLFLLFVIYSWMLHRNEYSFLFIYLFPINV